MKDTLNNQPWTAGSRVPPVRGLSEGLTTPHTKKSTFMLYSAPDLGASFGTTHATKNGHGRSRRERKNTFKNHIQEMCWLFCTECMRFRTGTSGGICEQLTELRVS